MLMKYQFKLTAAILVLAGCSSGTRSSDATNKTIVNTPSPTAGQIVEEHPARATTGIQDGVDATALNKYLKSLEQKPQQFVCSADSINMITGSKGTRVFVVPQDLESADGSAPKGPITVQLLEVDNAEGFLRNNAQTMSAGKLLASAGSYHISMSAGGKELRLKAGRKLALQLPNSGDKEMEIFYGKRDKEGSMDWAPVGKKLSRQTSEDSTYARVALTGYRDTLLAEMEVRPDHKPIVIDHNKFRQFEKVGVKMVDGRFYYAGRMKTTTGYVLKKVSALDAVLPGAYASIEVSQLGWLNMDKFWGVKPVEMLAQLAPNSRLSVVQTYVAYTQVKSIVAKRLLFNGMGAQTLKAIPGNPVKVIAIAWKDGKAHAQVQKLVAQEGQKIQLDLKPVSKEQLEKMIAM